MKRKLNFVYNKHVVSITVNGEKYLLNQLGELNKNVKFYFSSDVYNPDTLYPLLKWKEIWEESLINRDVISTFFAIDQFGNTFMVLCIGFGKDEFNDERRIYFAINSKECRVPIGSKNSWQGHSETFQLDNMNLKRYDCDPKEFKLIEV